MKWIEALKQWNADKDTWCIPRKGTKEFLEVMAIMKPPAEPQPVKIRRKRAPAPAVEEPDEFETKMKKAEDRLGADIRSALTTPKGEELFQQYVSLMKDASKPRPPSEKSQIDDPLDYEKDDLDFTENDVGDDGSTPGSVFDTIDEFIKALEGSEKTFKIASYYFYGGDGTLAGALKDIIEKNFDFPSKTELVVEMDVGKKKFKKLLKSYFPYNDYDEGAVEPPAIDFTIYYLDKMSDDQKTAAIKKLIGLARQIDYDFDLGRGKRALELLQKELAMRKVGRTKESKKEPKKEPKKESSKKPLESLSKAEILRIIKIYEDENKRRVRNKTVVSKEALIDFIKEKGLY